MNRYWLAAFFLIASTGCSSFPRDYAAVAARPVSEHGTESAWQGEWVSKHGHHGALRCILRHDPAQDAGKYETRFEAKFAGIFTAHYTVTLLRSDKQDTVELSGDQDLGWFSGGKYHYEARIVGEHFDSTYRCKSDEGEFHLVLDSPATQPKKSAESAAAR